MRVLAVAVFTLFAFVNLGAAEEAVVMKGHFVWNKQKDQKHDLTATFTPAGDDEWDVVFNFSWKNKPKRYSGEAKGSLVRGKFEGTALTDGGKRRWTYTGKTVAGTLRCKHTQTMRDGKKGTRETGKFELSK